MKKTPDNSRMMTDDGFSVGAGGGTEGGRGVGGGVKAVVVLVNHHSA